MERVWIDEAMRREWTEMGFEVGRWRDTTRALEDALVRVVVLKWWTVHREAPTSLLCRYPTSDIDLHPTLLTTCTWIEFPQSCRCAGSA